MAEYIDAVMKGLDTCHFIMRAHTGVYDVLEAAKSRDVAAENVVMMTMLRDPIKRVLSEFVHVSMSLTDQSSFYKVHQLRHTEKSKN